MIGAAQRIRFTRAILTIGTESSSYSLPIPLQVPREPVPQAEPARARGSVAPRGRHLRHPHPEQVRLHGELEAELKAASRLDGHLVEQPFGVKAEVACRVVDGHAAEPVKGQACYPRHRSLEEG